MRCSSPNEAPDRLVGPGIALPIVFLMYIGVTCFVIVILKREKASP